MSTYLLAFVICDFDTVIKQTSTNNINVSVIAAKNKIDQTQFALDTAVKITDYYEEYFGIRYPLPKQGKWCKNDQSKKNLLKIGAFSKDFILLRHQV